MKRNIKHSIVGFFMMLGLVVATVPVQYTSAIDVFSGSCGSGNSGNGGANGGNNSGGGSSSSICGAASSDDAPDIVKNIINTMLYVLGIIAVIMIVIGGVRYTTSNGDSSQIKAAKDTILYAVVGLVVAILAFAIVNFVVQSFK